MRVYLKLLANGASSHIPSDEGGHTRPPIGKTDRARGGKGARMPGHLGVMMIRDDFPSKIKVVGDIHLSVVEKATGVLGSCLDSPFIGSIGSILQPLEGVLRCRVVDLATFYRAL